MCRWIPTVHCPSTHAAAGAVKGIALGEVGAGARNLVAGGGADEAGDEEKGGEDVETHGDGCCWGSWLSLVGWW